MAYRMQYGGRPEITKAGVSKVSGVVNLLLVLRNLSAFRYLSIYMLVFHKVAKWVKD